MKFGQLIKYNVRNIFGGDHAEKQAGKPVPGHFWFFKKASNKVKVSGQPLSINIFW